MKYTVILLICLLPFFSYAQNRGGRGNDEQREKDKQKIDNLERIKLIDILNLDENTLVKFFAVKKDYEQKSFKLWDERKKIIDVIEADLKSGKKMTDEYVSAKIKRMSDCRKESDKLRQEYLKTIKKYLTAEKMAKYLVFEVRFQEEIMRGGWKDDKQKK